MLPFGQPDTYAMLRAQFAAKHLWVTAYDPDQRFPAGEYPNQHPGGDGLPAWTAADRVSSTSIFQPRAAAAATDL